MVRPIAALLLLVSLGVMMVAQAEVIATTEEPIPEEEQPAEIIVCHDPSEVYDECGAACGDRTCENQGRNDIVCSKQCLQGCYCRNGYVRNRGGKCIPAYRCNSGD